MYQFLFPNGDIRKLTASFVCSNKKEANMRSTTGILDKVLILPAIASIMMIADTANDTASFSDGSPALVVAIIAATVVFALLAIVATKIDRRCAEDYAYQIVANAALIGLTTTVLINMVWLFALTFGSGLPTPSGQMMTGILTLSWCIGYYWYRFRGLQS